MPANPLLAEAMYLRGTIERMGTGTEEMTKQCLAKGLGKPVFIPNYGFQTIIKRVAEKVTPQVTPQVEELLKRLEGEMNRLEIQAKLGLNDRENFRLNYIQPALNVELIEMTIPDKPNSRLQKYRLTTKGIELKKVLK